MAWRMTSSLSILCLKESDSKAPWTSLSVTTQQLKPHQECWISFVALPLTHGRVNHTFNIRTLPKDNGMLLRDWWTMWWLTRESPTIAGYLSWICGRHHDCNFHQIIELPHSHWTSHWTNLYLQHCHDVQVLWQSILSEGWCIIPIRHQGIERMIHWILKACWTCNL